MGGLPVVKSRYSEHQVQEFLSLASDEQYSPKSVQVSFIGYRHDGEWRLYAARVFIRNTTTEVAPLFVETKSICAGTFELSSIGVSVDAFLENCLLGEFKTSHHNLSIFDDTHNPSVNLTPFHPSSPQTRISVLSIRSQLRANLRFDQNIKLELNSLDTPYDTFDELVTLLSLARDNDGDASVEFVCFQSVVFNTSVKAIQESNANIVVHLAHGLDPKLFKLGVRRFPKGNMTSPIDAHRFSIPGIELEWSKADQFQAGVASFPVEDGDVLQCFANYNQLNYGNFWFADSAKTANPRRIALATFDKNLELAKDHLFLDPDEKNKSNEFEAGLLWMFWALGFSPVQIDLHQSKKRDHLPDFLFCDQRSNIIIAEATVGSLQNNNKLQKLKERTQRLQLSFDQNSSSQFEILPLIVTKLPERLVEDDRLVARNMGISVLASEELHSLFDRTSLYPDPNSIFDQLRQSPIN